MLLLAKDGVYLPTVPRAITQGILTSGNRADVLINCPAGENFTFNSTALELPRDYAPRVTDGGDAVIEAVLLKINAVASPWSTGRAVTDDPIRTCFSPTIRTLADPTFASCFRQTSSTCAARRWQRT
eukprot:scaffold717_cov60-Phaeocystis_antarctica.AAC.2